MKTKPEAAKTAARLSTLVSSADDQQSRIEALAKFISGYEPDTIGPVLGSVILDACSQPEAGLTFLTLLHRKALEKANPDWKWKDLDDYFRKSKLEDVWKIIIQVPEEDLPYVLAKISILLEVFMIMIEDDLLDPESDQECDGTEIALQVLKGRKSSRDSFTVALSSFPMEVRKFLKDMLAELDFIEDNPGEWRFSITSTSLQKYSEAENIKTHVGGGAMSGVIAQRNAENLVKRLELLLKVLQMFPSGHPSVDPSAESLLNIITKFQSGDDQVTISVMGDSVMVNDLQVERKGISISSFIRAFTERKISSLTFEPGISAKDIKMFAKLYNRPPKYIAEHGGMARLLELRGLNSISINRFHYQLVSENGDADQTLQRGDVTIEDAIFAELIDRLERGESIDSIPGGKIGDALKAVLRAAQDDREEQRGMIARFVVALDPTLLERGLLSNRTIQRGMAWKAVRKIIDRLLSSLPSSDPDIRHRALGKLMDMAMLAVERGKENSTIQIIENLSKLVKREQDPDVLYRAVVLVASLMEALLARGMMSIAIDASRIIKNLDVMKYPRTELEAARKRSLAEARQKMDTIDAASAIVSRLLSEDEVVSREARRLALIAPPDNLVTQLVNVFNEDNRRLRSRAFQMLLRMGKRGLNSMHSKLRQIVMAFDSNMESGTYQLPEQDWYMARNIIQILREIGSRDSEQILADLCRVPEPRIRRECLLALVKVSQTTAESLSLHLVMDKSIEVSRIALDVLTKQAMSNPAFIPRITKAYSKNTQLRGEIMESFSMLGKHRGVIDFVCSLVKEGPSGELFQDTELAAGAFRILRRYGGPEELPMLKEFQQQAEGGFLKKNKIDKDLLSLLRETISSLQLTDAVIEGEDTQETATEPKRAKKRTPSPPKKSGEDDDEITILGPDYHFEP